MSLKVAFLLAGLAGAIGIGIGYFVRLLVSMGQKGSAELQIKKMLLDAKEESKRITAEASGKA